jgi:hypothetical protein
MLFLQLAWLRRSFLAQRKCSGLMEWGSQAFFWLHPARGPCLTASLLLLLALQPASAQTPSLHANTNLSTDGYFVLSWDYSVPLDKSAVFQLKESVTDDFAAAKTIYRGPDKARVMSGKANGIYHYRLWLAGAPQVMGSDVVVVEVRHHSMIRALFFFTLGLIVFGSILATVLLGVRRWGVESS